jgi:hypothetical protein
MSPIDKPIESRHPADIAFGNKELSKRQQKLLSRLTATGSEVTVKKAEATMLDLSALTANTGDEFAMFTNKGTRIIYRGDTDSVPLSLSKLRQLAMSGYRWTGHTHPGITEVDLTVSNGDIAALNCFVQEESVIFNAAGRSVRFNKQGGVINVEPKGR